MCHFRLDKREIEAAARHRLRPPFRRPSSRASRPWPPTASSSCGEEPIEVTPLGRLLVRNVAMAFDAYLTAVVVGGGTAAGAPARYSRTV